MGTTPAKAARRGGARRHAVIVGGGLAGLASAILLGRSGWRVTVLERDVRRDAGGGDDAFARWSREGVAQFRHSHTFLARITAVLRERLPDVLHLLRAHGALELPLTVAPPPGLDLGPRERGDGELVLLGCRRAAFEWALWTVARAQPNVEIREGVLVEGLSSRPGPSDRPRVAGVRFRRFAADGRDGGDVRAPGIPWFAARDAEPAPKGARLQARRQHLRADLVVDASGRRSPAREWLRAIGAGEPHERVVPTGIFYFTRFYRLVGARPPGATTGLIAGDLGWIKLATFPGDAGTFSITVGTSIDDRPMRALSDAEAFEALIAAFPQIAPWRARGVSRPIDGARTPVLVMGGLANRQRSFVRDGAPLAEGFIPIGDAAYHTNPIYGRGATCALIAAVALDDALRAHPDDAAAAAVACDERTRREIEPFWEAAAAGDRASQARAAGASPFDPARVLSLATRPRRAVAALLGQAAGVFFEHGIVPALRKDATVYRTVMRVLNMLDDPRTSFLAPAVLARVLPTLAASLAGWEKRGVFPGPTRQEALEILARVAARRAARRDRRRPAPRAAVLEPTSDVAGHA